MDIELIGTVGVLVVGTRCADGPGEVLLHVRGGSESFLAHSDEPIPKGTSVLVIEARAGRAVVVVRLDGPRPPGTPIV